MSKKYVCYECESIFDEPLEVTERHGLDTPPFEHLYLCPVCLSDYYGVAQRCTICGEYILGNYYETIDGDMFCEECIIPHNIQLEWEV